MFKWPLSTRRGAHIQRPLGGESGVARRPALCDPVDCSPPGSSVHGIFWARVLQWVATPFQGIFLTQGSNPRLLCLLHCRWILYPLSHQRIPLRTSARLERTSFPARPIRQQGRSYSALPSSQASWWLMRPNPGEPSALVYSFKSSSHSETPSQTRPEKCLTKYLGTPVT